MKKPLLGAASLLAGLVLLAGTAPAMARVNVDVHIGVPAGVYVQPQPVYQPRPVYVTPQPVYVHAPPRRVYYQAPPRHWHKGHKHHYRGHPHGKKGRHHHPHYYR